MPNFSNKQMRNMKFTNEVTDKSGDVLTYYHSTAVVTLRRDRRYVLDSGGYQTVTTKRRINQFTPDGCQVFQRDGDWFVYNPTRKENIPFFDGMVLDATGYPVNGTGKE